MQCGGNGLRIVRNWRPCCASRRSLHASYSLLKEGKRERTFTPGTIQDVAVLGGGITGLATAYYLSRDFPKARITIYEASDRLGGWISSRRVPVKGGNILFEAGPRTLRPSSNGLLAAQLLQELDLAKHAIFPGKLSPAAQNRFLYYPNHLVRMPHPSHGLVENFWNVLREPIFKGLIWAAFMEVSKDQRDSSLQDESIGSFVARRFDTGMVDRILSGLTHGIYAGDVWKLSVKSLFPTLWRDEAEAGSLMRAYLKRRAEGVEITRNEWEFLQQMQKFEWDPILKQTLAMSTVFTLKDGLSMIPDALARSLASTGNVEIKTSTAVKSITLADDKNSVLIHPTNNSRRSQRHQMAISALAPTTLNALRAKGAPQLIPDIPYVTVMTVNLFFRTPNLHPAGFGYLIPRATPFENNPERALGVVFDDAYSPSPEQADISGLETNREYVEKVLGPADGVREVKKDQFYQQARDKGQIPVLNDFVWYNAPDQPNRQDTVNQPGTKLTVMLGGHWWDDWPSYPNEKEGLGMALSLLERHLGIKEAPEAWQVNLQKDCIPQYTVGHEERLQTAHTNLWREYHGKVRVVGNWMSGVGVNDCLRSAWEVVKGLHGGGAKTGLEMVGTTDFVRMVPLSVMQKEEQRQKEEEQ